MPSFFSKVICNQPNRRHPCFFGQSRIDIYISERSGPEEKKGRIFLPNSLDVPCSLVNPQQRLSHYTCPI